MQNQVPAEHPLINLALLEALKHAGKHVDEIDNFMPFLAVAIRELPKEPFDVLDVKQILFERIGIEVPAPCIKILLTRAKARGLIRVEHKTFLYKMPAALDKISDGFKQKNAEIKAAHDNLLAAYIAYVNKEHGFAVSDVEAVAQINKFIRKHLSFSASMVASSGYAESESGKIKNDDFAVAAFIKSLRGTATLEYFATLVKGRLLADFLLYADLYSDKKEYKDINVYLDTPLVLSLLGYSGKLKKVVCSDLLKILLNNKISVGIFDITIEETRGVLKAWAHDLRIRNYTNFKNKNTLNYLLNSRIDSTALETEDRALELTLQKLQITRKTIDVDYLKRKVEDTPLGYFLRAKNFPSIHDMALLGCAWVKSGSMG